MTETLDQLRAEVVEHGLLDYDQEQELLERVEAAERLNGGFAREVNNLTGELTKWKDSYSLQAQELEAAEAAVQRVREVIEQLDDHSRPRTAHKFTLATLLRRALDGGE